MQKQQAQHVIYLIRHAKSLYNVAEVQTKKLLKQKNITQNIRSTPQYFKMKFQEKYEDCDIYDSEETYAQCERCKQKMKNIDLDLIISSPLRRSLQTCNLIFKDHKSKAPMVADPVFREVMSSRCDIGSRLRQSMKDFPQFDYSLIKHPDYWYIETLDDLTKKSMMQKLEEVKQQDKGKIAFQLAMQYIIALNEKRKVNPAAISEAVSSVQVQRARLKQLMLKYKSIAVVTHNYNIQTYTGSKSPNCCVFVYKPEYFDLPIDKIPPSYI